MIAELYEDKLRLLEEKAVEARKLLISTLLEAGSGAVLHYFRFNCRTARCIRAKYLWLYALDLALVINLLH